MTQQRDAILGFGLMIAFGAAVAMAISFMTWIGFVLGVTTSLAAAAIAGTDFE